MALRGVGQVYTEKLINEGRMSRDKIDELKEAANAVFNTVPARNPKPPPRIPF